MKAKSVLSLAPLTIVPILVSVIRADYEKNTFGLYTISNVAPNYLEFMPSDDFEVTVNRDVIRSHPQYQEYVEVVKKYLAEQALKEIQRSRQPPPQQFETEEKNKKKNKDEDDSASEEEEDDEKQEKVSSEENFDDDDDDDQPQNDEEAAFDSPIEVHLHRPKPKNKDKNKDKKKPEKTEDDQDKEDSNKEESPEKKPWLVSRVFTRVKSMVPKMPRLPTPKLRLTFESPSSNKKNKKDKNKNEEENDDEPKRRPKPISQGNGSSDSVYEQHMQLHHHHQGMMQEVYGGKAKLTRRPTGFGFNFSGGPPKRESENEEVERKPFGRRNPKFPFSHRY